MIIMLNQRHSMTNPVAISGNQRPSVIIMLNQRHSMTNPVAISGNQSSPADGPHGLVLNGNQRS